MVSGQSRELLESRFPEVTTVPVDVRVPWIHGGAAIRRGSRSGWLQRRIAVAAWTVRETVPAALRYARLVRSTGTDLLHLNNNLESQLDGIVAGVLTGVPIVAHARGMQRWTRSLALVQRLVSLHVAISEVIRANLVEIGVPESRIRVVHNGLDTARFHEDSLRGPELRTEFGLTDDDLCFGVFGRIVPYKGVVEFVEAASRVLSERPRARAFIVGDASDGGGQYMARVEEAVRQSGVGDRIVFTGYRRDVAAMMGMMDVVVHASVGPEPFGRVVVEGMAAGRAVVASRAPGPVELIDEGRTGLLFERGSAEALAAAVGTLLDDPERARRMGTAAREEAAHRFDTGILARRMADVFREARGAGES